MNTSHEMRKDALTPSVGNRMRKMTNFLRSKKSKTATTSMGNTKKRRNHFLDPVTVIENNRELASALSKARARIRDLESEQVRLHGERHELMEQVTAMTTELAKCNGKVDEKQAEDAQFVKEISESLYSQLEKTTEMLLQCSNILADALRCVVCLQNMSQSDSRNLSTHMSRTPKKTFCGEITQTSYEADAALSLTAMTPSSSSASSFSENEDAVSQTTNGELTPDTLPNPRSLHYSPDTMYVDVSPTQSGHDSPIFSSTPNVNPAHFATTPEECGGSLTVQRCDSMEIVHASPVISSHTRRVSQRNSIKANFCGYKEPSLISKLRQGDPHTDRSLYSPSTLHLGNGRCHFKRKNKQTGGNLKKKIKNNGCGRKRNIDSCQ